MAKAIICDVCGSKPAMYKSQQMIRLRPVIDGVDARTIKGEKLDICSGCADKVEERYVPVG